MKHAPYADAPQCLLRVVLDQQGVHALHCLVENDGKVIGQVPVSKAELSMTAGDFAMMRIDVLGKWARVDYAPDPPPVFGPYSQLVTS